LGYFDKFANHANFIERQNKKNYKTKFSTISILKNKINKRNFEKNYKKKQNRKEKVKKPCVQKTNIQGNTIAIYLKTL